MYSILFQEGYQFPFVVQPGHIVFEAGANTGLSPSKKARKF
jgi:hypothetical protein